MAGWDDLKGPRRPGGSGGFDKIPDFDFKQVNLPPIRPQHIVAGVAVIAFLWLATGLYRVELQEQAVVMVFGKHTSTTGAGLHWNFPYPVGEVVKVRTEEIKRVEIGFRTGMSPASSDMLKKESLMLTEGANMIDIQMSVQYVVTDPARFLFNVSDPSRELVDRGLSETVKNVAEAALREVVGNTTIDDILTVGKSKVQQAVHDLMQNILDRYDAGVSVNLVQLQDVHPPEQVRDAFRDVNNAEEDKNRLIREAEGYYNSVIPEARGEAAQVVAEAEAYKAERVAKSTGDAQRFESQLKEYRKAPEITKKRLYLETMEEVMGKVEKVVIDPAVGKNLMPLLPLAKGLAPAVKEGN